jgi:hypothetical protein
VAREENYKHLHSELPLSAANFKSPELKNRSSFCCTTMSKLLHDDMGILNLVIICEMNCSIILFFNIQHKICGSIVFR